MPGVYWFLDANGNVLYVGKAKDLKNRVTQYALLQDERPQILSLVTTAAELKFETQVSELQALLVEAELIRKYQPSFNILLKDDKSSLYICITKEAFPRVLTMRKAELVREEQKMHVFGPFPSAFKVKQVLRIARHIFQWCDRPLAPSTISTDAKVKPVKPCFYSHIGLCRGACTGNVAQEDYAESIQHLRAFLHGESTSIIREIKQEMEHAIASQSFEKAALLRDQVQAITEVTSKAYRLAPDATLPVLTAHMEQEALISLRSILRTYISLPATFHIHRIEGYDISNIQGTNASCSMVVAIDGKMDSSEYKHFGIKTLNTPNDFAMLREALTRRQNHPEWGTPDILLIDGGKGQLRSVLRVWNWTCPVVSIAKDPDRLLIPLVVDEKGKAYTAKQRDAKDTKRIIYKEILLTPDIPATRLLQSIRNESHRFAKRLHTIKRTKAMIES